MTVRRWLGRTIAALAIVALAVAFRRELIAWFTGRSLGDGAAGPGAQVNAGALAVTASVAPDPPQAGKNRVRIEVKDGGGAPVDGATVSVTWDMPAMGAMSEMKATVAATPLGGGAYATELELPGDGTYLIEVAVESPRGAATARYDLATGTRGLTARRHAAEGPGSATRAIDERTVINVDEARRDYLGIRTGAAARAPMTLTVRAVGRVAFDETRLTDVVVRVSGYITKLRVSATGQAVRRGETLFTFYSPELFNAEQEALFAKQRAGDAADDALLRASEKKLRLWGMGDEQLAALYARGEPLEDAPVAAPASGVVIEKDVVEGDAISAGARLFRIAPLDRVWVEADVYESDLARISKGQRATITLSYLPGRTFDGTVAFVYPYLDPASRTGRVRVELPNAALELKPDMFATVAFRIELGLRLQIPRSAVVYTGPRRIVFVDLGGGRIAPRDVTIGAETDDAVEIVDGLADGERVITSGNFLVASESRIRSAAFWDGAP